MEEQLETIINTLRCEKYNVHGVVCPESIILSFRDINSEGLKESLMDKVKGYFVRAYGFGVVHNDFDLQTGDLDLYFRKS